MDASTELLASEIGLSWLSMSRANSALSEADSFVSANTQFAPGVLGIEEFEPPPGKALTTEARRLLQGCAGEWKETVMPLPSVGIKMRYRKPKYWIVSVAAVCGVGSEELDRRMEWWFSKRGGEGLFG